MLLEKVSTDLHKIATKLAEEDTEKQEKKFPHPLNIQYFWLGKFIHKKNFCGLEKFHLENCHHENHS